jgi:predicted ribosome quality control (RQC) complex YloA/Tae2 family protein
MNATAITTTSKSSNAAKVVRTKAPSKVKAPAKSTLEKKLERENKALQKAIEELKGANDKLLDQLNETRDRLGQIQIHFDSVLGIRLVQRGQIGQKLGQSVKAELNKSVTNERDALRTSIVTMAYNHLDQGQQEQYDDITGLKRTSGKLKGTKLSSLTSNVQLKS